MEDKQTQKIIAWAQIGVGLLMLVLVAIKWLTRHPDDRHPGTVLTIIFGIVFPMRAVRILWQLKQEKKPAYTIMPAMQNQYITHSF